MATFNMRSEMPVSAEELSAWHFREGALTRLLAPWVYARVVSSTGPLANGSAVVVELRKGTARIDWHAVHDRVEPGKGFRDTQTRGPFHSWAHEHRFVSLSSESSALEDRVEYQEPFPPFGRWCCAGLIQRELSRQFTFRHARTLNDLRRGSERTSRAPNRVAISGASGLVGTQLAAFLDCAGDSVRRIVRSSAQAGANDIVWNQSSGEFDRAKLEACDAVVHLAGENVAGGRWTDQRKSAIRSSRVDGTRHLCLALARLERKPRVLVCASGVGIYGSRGAEQLVESSAGGDGFLADVCREWEHATQPARDAGIRVVNLRIGVVISARGGVLGKLVTPFLCGAGGPVGTGDQGMSWIALDDLIAAIAFAIDNENISGALNATAPEPISNRDFGRELARVLKRPFLAPLPAFAVRALFGQMGQELLLSGAFVQPKILIEHGFHFVFPSLHPALRFELGRLERTSAGSIS